MSTWSCKRCTFENGASSASCEICGVERPISPSTPIQMVGSARHDDDDATSLIDEDGANERKGAPLSRASSRAWLPPHHRPAPVQQAPPGGVAAAAAAPMRTSSRRAAAAALDAAAQSRAAQEAEDELLAQRLQREFDAEEEVQPRPIGEGEVPDDRDQARAHRDDVTMATPSIFDAFMHAHANKPLPPAPPSAPAHPSPAAASRWGHIKRKADEDAAYLEDDSENENDEDEEDADDEYVAPRRKRQTTRRRKSAPSSLELLSSPDAPIAPAAAAASSAMAPPRPAEPAAASSSAPNTPALARSGSLASRSRANSTTPPMRLPELQSGASSTRGSQRASSAAADAASSNPRAVSALPVDLVSPSPDDLAIDHSPLWSLRSFAASSPLAASELHALLERYVSKPTGPSRATINNVRMDHELATFLECLFRVVRIHRGWFTLPTHIVDGIWHSMLSESVSLEGARAAYATVVQIQLLSPCSFLPSLSSWNGWCRECIEFSIWLQQKDSLKRTGAFNDMARDVNDASSTAASLATATAAAAAAAAPAASVASEMSARHAELDRQQTIAAQLSHQRRAEFYYAKWCLKLDAMTRAFAMDARAREIGISAFERQLIGATQTMRAAHHDHPMPPPPSPSDSAEAVLSVSPPLLVSLIMRGDQLLVASSLLASKAAIDAATGPKLDEEEADRLAAMERARGTRGRGGGRGRSRGGRGGTSSRLASATVASASHSAHAPEADPIDSDDSFLSWWLSLLDFLGLQRRRTSQQNQQVIGTFRSADCLAIYQETVLAFIHTLQRHAKDKVRHIMHHE